ncbi:MAG: alpha/beta fold hydrolase [Chloroflexi bacterium]|nr:alpha/beta fold hydrolase [Chloroflexota bacterium]
MTASSIEYVKRGFVHSPDGNIDYREAGEGPAILMIHGTPESSAKMSRSFPYLRDEFRCVAMSTMGYGDSDRPPEPYTSTEQFAQAAIWVLDGLGIEKAAVFGTHTGAVIAACVAAEWPDRVSAAILEEPFNWNTPARLQAMKSVHTGEGESADGSHLADIWRDVHAAREGATRTAHEMRQSVIDEIKANQGEQPAVYEGMGWHGAAPWAICHYDAWSAAERIQAPTLVIHGTQSNLGRSHERFLTTLRHARGIRPPAPNQFSWSLDLPLWSAEVKSFLHEEAGL